MDNKELLNAIGGADDRFIEEAAPEERMPLFAKKNAGGNATDEVKDGGAIKFPGKTSAAGGNAIGSASTASAAGKTGAAKIQRTPWKKWLGAVAAVLAVCVIGGVAIGSLGAGAKKSDYFAAEQEYYYSDYKSEASNGFSGSTGNYDYVADVMEAPQTYSKDASYESVGGSLISSSVANLGKDNLKLIYTANMTLQTSDFDESEKALSALVAQYNGYFESVKMSNNGMYSNSNYRYASYTVRVPAASYEAFINAVGESSHVVGLSQSVQDIGESYYEIEGRLETLYTKQERLQELLKQAGNMSDIIELESALSDTEYQIDSLKGSLNHYDSLVGYSTVNIELETVSRPGSSISEDTSFGARIANAFRRGLNTAADNFEYFILWVIENLVGIIIFAVVVVLLIRFRPIKKLWRRIRKSKVE